MYRSISYGLLSATGFPPSYIPFILLGTALAIDLAVMWRWRPVVGTLAVIGATYAGAWLTQQVTLMPPFHLATAPMAALLLWSVWASARWAQQSSTVARWDTDETSRRIELQVGRDLQWIRVNGTVVGGLAGLVIYTVAQLLS